MVKKGETMAKLRQNYDITNAKLQIFNSNSMVKQLRNYDKNYREKISEQFYGQTMAKPWPNYSKTMVKLWPNYKQTMAKLWKNQAKVYLTIARVWRKHGLTIVNLKQNYGKTVAKIWRKYEELARKKGNTDFQYLITGNQY